MTTCRIADIAKVIRGVSWDKSEASDAARDGYLPILRAGSIGDVLNIADDLVWVPSSNVSDVQRIRAGDIAICMSSGSASVVGKTAAAKTDWPGSVGAFCALLRSDANKCLPEYLGFYLKSTTFRRWTSEAQGANIKNIRKSALEDFSIPLPPLPEQHRIVDFLSRAEGIVRLRREAEKKAAELISALFLDMFGDPAMNPKGWDIKPLHAVAEVGSGNGFPNAYQGKTDATYPFYKVSDMNTEGNEVEMTVANNYITEDDLAALRAKVFPAGTVIFPKIGAAIATNKKRVLTRPSCFDNNVMGITPGNGLMPSFLHALMFSKNISDFASDSNPPSMRKTTVEAWEIPVPPLDLQAEFGRQLEAIRSIQSQQSAASTKAQATFDALLAQTFYDRG
ncbi:MAG: restriction endonuclease subunit S [Alphaproteobacteria bacterium]